MLRTTAFRAVMMNQAASGSKAPRPSMKQLKSQLRRLKKREAALETERERLGGYKQFFSATSGKANNDAATQYDLSVLPTNKDVEAHLTNALLYNKDPRTKLELIASLSESHLISLAAPVSTAWDPYDIKPQAFALGVYLALPVFTSVQHLAVFCQKHGFAVCDPGGRPWTSAEGELLLEAGKEGKGSRLWEATRRKKKSKKRSTMKPVGAEAGEGMKVAHEDDDGVGVEEAAATRTDAEGAPPDREAPSSSDAKDSHSSVREQLEGVQRFEYSKASPLHTFGPPVLPHFIGYFADLDTLLSNLEVIPKSVDIVINPGSPGEFVLSRELTTMFLRKAPIVHDAYKRVEKELRAEFHQFFAAECPEISGAWSCCVPVPTAADHGAISAIGDTEYEAIVLIDSMDWDVTMENIRRGKREGKLVGHRSLHLYPADEAAGHLREASTLFYDYDTGGERHQEIAEQLERERQENERKARRSRMGYGFYQGSQAPTDEDETEMPSAGKPTSPPDGTMGLRPMGPQVTIQTGVSTDSMYSDPTNGYTEPWKVVERVIQDQIRRQRQ